MLFVYSIYMLMLIDYFLSKKTVFLSKKDIFYSTTKINLYAI